MNNNKDCRVGQLTSNDGDGQLKDSHLQKKNNDNNDDVCNNDNNNMVIIRIIT